MQVWATIAVTGWLTALAVCDIRAQRLPNALTLPGAAVILLAAAGHGAGGPALAGALALSSSYLLMHLISPTAMGAGDVKLALGLGALTGAFGVAAWVLAAIGAPVVTALAGILTGRRVLPHGPAMCAAGVVAMWGL